MRENSLFSLISSYNKGMNYIEIFPESFIIKNDNDEIICTYDENEGALFPAPSSQ